METAYVCACMCIYIYIGSGIVWGFSSLFVLFLNLRFWPVSLLFGEFWTWKLIFTQYLQHFGFWTFFLSIIFGSLSWNLQHFGAGSWHFSDFGIYMIVPQFSSIFSTVFIDSYMVFIYFCWSLAWFLEMHDVQTINCTCIEVYMRD